MKIRRLGGLLIVVLAPALAAAAAVQFNASAVFNADVIVNDPGAAPVDAVNSPVDSPTGGNRAFVTQAAAASLGCSSPFGLPDNGFFASNADHPDVQLAYNNEDNGNNARRSAGSDTYAFTAPSGNYSNVHFFFTAGEAGINPDPSVTVTLGYATGLPQTANITVPDWFDDPAAPPYRLFNGGDRAPPSATFCEDANDVAIFGFDIAADSARVLQSVSITRTDTGAAILSFFGATGVTPDQEVPEPAGLVLLSTGFGGVALLLRRRSSH